MYSALCYILTVLVLLCLLFANFRICKCKRYSILNLWLLRISCNTYSNASPDIERIQNQMDRFMPLSSKWGKLDKSLMHKYMKLFLQDIISMWHFDIYPTYRSVLQFKIFIKTSIQISVFEIWAHAIIHLIIAHNIISYIQYSQLKVNFCMEAQFIYGTQKVCFNYPTQQTTFRLCAVINRLEDADVNNYH